MVLGKHSNLWEQDETQFSSLAYIMDYLEPLKKKPLEEGENGLALFGEIYK